MTLYDATMALRNGMLTFPGDPPFEIRPVFQQKQGDPCNLAVMALGTHIGTHVDSPAHYLETGATVDQLPLDTLIGPGMVLDVRGRSVIDRNALESFDPRDRPRVLLKTDNSRKLLEETFSAEYVCLTEGGAQLLVERGLRLVGIDYLSVDKTDNADGPVHRILLSAGIVVVEGVNLADIPSGPCEIYCLPLKISGGDGAPARMIVRM